MTNTHLHSDISTECYAQYPSGASPLRYRFSNFSTICPSETPPRRYLCSELTVLYVRSELHHSDAFSDLGTLCPSETTPRKYLCSELGTICPFGTPLLRCLLWFRYYMSFRNTSPIGYHFLFGYYMSVLNISPTIDLLLLCNHVPDSYNILAVLLICTMKSGKNLGSDTI